MAVREFNGTSDYVRFPGINLNAQCVAVLAKPLDTTVPVGWQAVHTSTDSSGHSQVTSYVRGTAGTGARNQGSLHYDNTLAGGSVGTATTKAITNPTSWKILV